MNGQLYLTKRIDSKLEELAKTHKVHKEALGNTLLLLAMCDEDQVEQCVNLIKAWDIKGATEMEKRGM